MGVQIKRIPKLHYYNKKWSYLPIFIVSGREWQDFDKIKRARELKNILYVINILLKMSSSPS